MYLLRIVLCAGVYPWALFYCEQFFSLSCNSITYVIVVCHCIDQSAVTYIFFPLKLMSTEIPIRALKDVRKLVGITSTKNPHISSNCSKWVSNHTNVIIGYLL